jgi:hypothetical protein
MQLLFAISIICFLALVWAVVTIARHIAAGHKARTAAQSQGDFAHHLFAATENREERRPRAVPPQTVRDVAARKSWNTAPASIEIQPANEESATSSVQERPVQGRRKAPQTSHHGAAERLDWAYFNKDAGDLTDPYQTRPSRANSGARTTSPNRY